MSQHDNAEAPSTQELQAIGLSRARAHDVAVKWRTDEELRGISAQEVSIMLGGDEEARADARRILTDADITGTDLSLLRSALAAGPLPR